MQAGGCAVWMETRWDGPHPLILRSVRKPKERVIQTMNTSASRDLVSVNMLSHHFNTKFYTHTANYNEVISQIGLIKEN